jgi:hypothetical protein
MAGSGEDAVRFAAFEPLYRYGGGTPNTKIVEAPQRQ